MVDKIQICKVRNVKTPERGTAVAAGLDFFIPSDLTLEDMKVMFSKTHHELDFETDPQTGFVTKIAIKPGQSACIPSGIKAKIPHGYCMEFHNKSGVACKNSLLNGACVIGETLIETNKGKFPANVLTSSFCKENNILIKSWNYHTNTYEFKPCCGFKPSKTAVCIRVVFEDGTEIIGADDHLVYDKDENKWIPLKNFL